jgi:hypothetical protein
VVGAVTIVLSAGEGAPMSDAPHHRHRHRHAARSRADGGRGRIRGGCPGSSDRIAGSSTLVTVAWFETAATPWG